MSHLSAPAVSTSATKEACSPAHSAKPFTRFFQQLAQRLATETLTPPSQRSPSSSLASPQPFAPRASMPATADSHRRASDRNRASAADDPVAQWILAPHADAANEIRWTGVVAGSLRTVQVDRVFRAGPAPQIAAASPDEDTWWIIDYKTAHEDGLDPAALLPELRRQFAPQIEAYAAVLRNLRGANINLCGGLYYPRMALFDWWQLNSPASTRI